MQCFFKMVKQFSHHNFVLISIFVENTYEIL